MFFPYQRGTQSVSCPILFLSKWTLTLLMPSAAVLTGLGAYNELVCSFQIQVLKVLVNLSANPAMTRHLLRAQVRFLLFHYIFSIYVDMCAAMCIY